MAYRVCLYGKKRFAMLRLGDKVQGGAPPFAQKALEVFKKTRIGQEFRA